MINTVNSSESTISKYCLRTCQGKSATPTHPEHSSSFYTTVFQQGWVVVQCRWWWYGLGEKTWNGLGENVGKPQVLFVHFRYRAGFPNTADYHSSKVLPNLKVLEHNKDQSFAVPFICKQQDFAKLFKAKRHWELVGKKVNTWSLTCFQELVKIEDHHMCLRHF